MDQNLIDSSEVYIRKYKELLSKKSHYEAQVLAARTQMNKILEEQELLEGATIAIAKVKPLLSASSIKQCENLANSLLNNVFELPYTVQYNPESCRFQLNKGNYVTDLAEAEGGGLISAIGFVFDTYLLIKLNRRKLVFYDEHFQQISAKYFPSFMAFMRDLCHDLGVDIAMVSHDSRITEDMVDHIYLIEDGKSKKLK